jgi:fucose permease
MMNILKRIKSHPKFGLILLAYIAFIALGMPDGLMGVAWPSIRYGFGIPLDALGSLLAVSVAGYIISSFFSGRLISRLGVGRVLAISCAMTGVALLGYTLVPQWWMMVSLAILSGLGAGAIDSGLNAYVASHFGEGLMQWLHASYGVGITTGPLIMTVALNSFNSWRIGYRIVASFQLVLALVFTITLPMWKEKVQSEGVDKPKILTDYKTSLRETLRQSQVWFSLLQFFLYVGTEVSIGTWTYTLLTESRGINPEVAGLWTGSYWAMFTIGRAVAGLFAKKVGVNKLVLGSLGLALSMAGLLWWNPVPWTNLLAVAMIGLAIAPIFPALVSGTSQRVSPRFAANTIGMQMSASGLATVVIPSLLGVLARYINLEVIPIYLLALFVAQTVLYLIGLQRRKNGSLLESTDSQL